MSGIAGSNTSGGMDIRLLWELFCHVEVSATARSLVRKSPSECGVSQFNQGTSQRKPGPTRAIEP